MLLGKRTFNAIRILGSNERWDRRFEKHPDHLRQVPNLTERWEIVGPRSGRVNPLVEPACAFTKVGLAFGVKGDEILAQVDKCTETSFTVVCY